MSTFRIFLGEKFLAPTTALALLMDCALWLYLAYNVTAVEGQAPLHYNIYFGIDLLGPWWWIFFLPAVGFGVWLVNGIASVVLCTRERFAAFFLAIANVLLQLLLWIGGYVAMTHLSNP